LGHTLYADMVARLHSFLIAANTRLGEVHCILPNGSGIAEGRDLKDKSFNLAQMPNRIK